MHNRNEVLLKRLALICGIAAAFSVATRNYEPAAPAGAYADPAPAPEPEPPAPAAAPAQPVSGDPLQVWARRVSADTSLPAWKRYWAAQAIAQGWKTQGYRPVTCYGPFDGEPAHDYLYYWLPAEIHGGGRHHCDAAIVSAPRPDQDPALGVPKGSIIWTDLGVRFVGDRGGRVIHHFDYWNRTDLSSSRPRPFRVLRYGYGETGNPPLRDAR